MNRHGTGRIAGTEGAAGGGRFSALQRASVF